VIEPLADMPEGTLGFRAVGRVEPDDYTEVLDPAIDAVMAAHERVDLVYVIGEDFDRYSLGALWQDARLGARPVRSWGRIALVTDHDWLGHAIRVVGFALPGEVEVFPLARQQDAVDWASAAA
jgi:hypothetical protein